MTELNFYTLQPPQVVTIGPLSFQHRPRLLELVFSSINQNPINRCILTALEE